MKRIIALLFMLAVPALLIAQQLERDVVATGGAYETSANMSLSYTVGEPVIETKSTSSLVLTQGFQQTNVEPVGIEVPAKNLSISAYPNPTASRVVLELETAKEKKVSVQVFDVQGKALKAPVTKEALQGEQRFTIDLSEYAAGTYMLGLTNTKGKRLHTIKVQKIY
jgi:hypothetical protein